MKIPSQPHTYPNESDFSRTLYEKSEIFYHDQVARSGRSWASSRPNAWSGDGEWQTADGFTDCMVQLTGSSKYICVEMFALII